jgi:S-adenosylmethionine:tRNA ribosyltransferase-isomerase
MRTDDFAFDLPEDRIALRPASPRDAARLLVVQGGDAPFEDRIVRDLPALLRPGDSLVVNDTRVLPTQLEGRRGDARVSATLIQRIDARRWWALAKGARRLRTLDVINFGAKLQATVEERRDDGALALRLECDGPVEAALESAGAMPLPPYIARRRAADARDRDDYQTVYAAQDGSVAAPTAGLHFTPDLLARLHAAGVAVETLTLHVGPGTFLTVKAGDTADHVMHAEWGALSLDAAERLNAARGAGGRVIAVGTTALRLLETAAGPDRRLRAFAGETAIFITPGHAFRGADGLMTNFHLPRSTLFMLVSALMGLERMRAAYAHAIAAGYRFYSYGDASLLLP